MFVWFSFHIIYYYYYYYFFNGCLSVMRVGMAEVGGRCGIQVAGTQLGQLATRARHFDSLWRCNEIESQDSLSPPPLPPPFNARVNLFSVSVILVSYLSI